MEERNHKKGDGEGCGGGCGSASACSCGGGSCAGQGMMHGTMCCGGGHRHFLLRIVILIAVLGFVFWSGIKIGELKAYFGGDGYMMGGGRGGYGRMYNMMGGNAGWEGLYGRGTAASPQPVTPGLK